MFLASNEVGKKLFLESTNQSAPYFRNKNGDYIIWHSGNHGSDSGLNADLLDGNHATAFSLSGHTHSYAGSSSVGGSANSSIKLKTSRKLWGQSFNGTSDVNGNMTINVTTANAISINTSSANGSYRSTSGWGNMIFMIGNSDDGTSKGIELSLGGNGVARLDATSFEINSTYVFNINAHANGFDISSTANFAPHYITNFAIYKGSPGSGEIVMFCDSNKRVGILTASPSYSLHVNGSCNVSTFYIGGEQITFTT